MKTTASPVSSVKADSPVVKALNVLLADSYALMANTHYAHWNVEGAGFFVLHKASRGAVWYQPAIIPRPSR